MKSIEGTCRDHNLVEIISTCISYIGEPVTSKMDEINGGFSGCHRVCGNNCNLFTCFRRRGNKQAAEEKQYVFVLYLNPDKLNSQKTADEIS